MPSLTRINAVARPDFVALLGGIFEHSPWVAEAVAAARPFAAAAALHAAMVAAVKHASQPAQLALLRAHPDLAGKEAQQGALTVSSTAEQNSAALDRLSPEERTTIAHNNAAYRARFGFPFVICVRNHDKAGIFAAFAQRLENPAELEFATALDEVYEIARLRLEKLLEAP